MMRKVMALYRGKRRSAYFERPTTHLVEEKAPSFKTSSGFEIERKYAHGSSWA
jgi:hypothetical protein